jgi:hypothetical protein
MRLLPSLGLTFLLLLASSLLPEESTGQECPLGRISFVFIDNWDIFDLTVLEPGAKVGWFYRAANAIHVRTREDFVRKELLFRTGDCFDPLLLEESERLLRSYSFIGESDVFPIQKPDGDRDVVVYTRDDWTTKVNLGFRIDDGVKIEGLDLSEENFLGMGMLARLFFKKTNETQDLGTEFQTPRLFGTRLDGRVSFGTTRKGNFYEEAFTFPFVGEVGHFAARQSFSWRETVFSYSTHPSLDYTNLLVPFLDQCWDVAVGKRIGRPGSLTVFGLGLSKESTQFREFPKDVEYVVDKDFSNPVPGDSIGVAEVGGQTVSRRANRINLFLGLRKLGFVTRRGLDALRGVQDVQVGTEAFLGLGRAPNFLQEGGGLSQNDLHVQASLFAGGAWDRWVMNAQASMEGRYVFSEGGPGVWRDIFSEADFYLYWLPKPEGAHSVLFRLSGAGGWSAETPFQLTLGGYSSVRGYSQDDFPGGRRMVLTLEDRVRLPGPVRELLDFGLTFFLDAGYMGAGDVPFGGDSGWIAAVGGGIRFGFPPRTTNMTRIDVALPLGGRTRLSDVILRISLNELLGLLPGVRDEQLLRSLRSVAKATFTTIPR